MSEIDNELNGYKYSFNKVNPYLQSTSKTQTSELNSDFLIESKQKFYKHKLKQPLISKTAREVQSSIQKQFIKTQNKVKEFKYQQKHLLDIYVRKFQKKQLSQSLTETKSHQQKIKIVNSPEELKLVNSPQEQFSHIKKQVKKQNKIKPISSLTQFWLNHPYLSKQNKNKKKQQSKYKNKTSTILLQKSRQYLGSETRTNKRQLVIKTENDYSSSKQCIQLKGKKMAQFIKTSKNKTRKLFGAYEYLTPKSKVMNKNLININFLRQNKDQRRIKMFTQAQQKQIISEFYNKVQ